MLRAEPRALALGERDVAPRVVVDRLVARPRAVEHRPGLAIADGGERRQRRVVPLAQRLAPPPRGRRRTAAGRGPRSAARAPRGRRRRGRATRPAPDTRAATGSGRVALERRDLQRADDAPRVAEVGPRGERRGQPTTAAPASASSAVAFEVGLEGRPAPPRPTAARPCPGPPSPPAARTPCRRRGSRSPPRSAEVARARPRRASGTSATLNGWSGSTRSRPWWTTRRRSSGVAFAVPMSRPR